jgi:hypothetical protein
LAMQFSPRVWAYQIGRFPGSGLLPGTGKSSPSQDENP